MVVVHVRTNNTSGYQIRPTINYDASYYGWLLSSGKIRHSKGAREPNDSNSVWQYNVNIARAVLKYCESMTTQHNTIFIVFLNENAQSAINTLNK